MHFAFIFSRIRFQHTLNPENRSFFLCSDVVPNCLH
uniref:Uncharacterized protein n=1 Tax=Lepeophtheirus salmonis TaxID=72036 RepID=A0A0K2V3P3_LEPSM